MVLFELVMFVYCCFSLLGVWIFIVVVSLSLVLFSSIANSVARFVYLVVMSYISC